MTVEYTAADAHAAAARGAEWLDEKCPGWESRIDLEVLDLSDSGVCVLGQTATCILGPAIAQDVGRGRDGYWRVFDAEHWYLGNKGEQQRLGFDVPAGGAWVENEARYEMLTIAWIELVRERLAVPA